jgi:hypothetical protein
MTLTARDLTQLALETAKEDPMTARAQLQEAATLWVAAGEARLAAFCLHQRAGLALRVGESPIVDLAAAAQLLVNQPEARAVVLLDLGYALRVAKDRRRARLVLKESAEAALKVGNVALADEARGVLREVEAERMGVDLNMALRRHSPLLADAPLRDMMTLSPTVARRAAEQVARERAVEEELAGMRQELQDAESGKQKAETA